jgi:hypothetical protein
VSKLSNHALKRVIAKPTSLRGAVLAYLMLGGALNIRDDGDDEDAWNRVSKALDHVWYKQLTEYERSTFNYETRIAIAEALGEPSC